MFQTVIGKHVDGVDQQVLGSLHFDAVSWQSKAYMAMSAGSKSYSSALCLIPPRSAWPAIQRIRSHLDKGFVRWPPHINLLYPFIHDSQFEDAASVARQALKTIEPFKITLSEFKYFQHSRSSFTIWLSPQDTSGLVHLQSQLVAAFPSLTDLNDDPSRGITQFTPHLSVGQLRDPRKVERKMKELQSQWETISFDVTEVALISRRSFIEPFSTQYVIQLGMEQGEDQSVHVSGPDDKPYQSAQHAIPKGIIKASKPYIATVGTVGLELKRSNSGSAPLAQVGEQQPQTVSKAERPVADDGQSKHTTTSVEGSAFSVADPSTNTVWYFAYGEDMSPAWLQKRGVTPRQSIPACVQGFVLAFNHKGGTANLVPADPSAHQLAYGVLHLLTTEHMALLTMDQHERWSYEIYAHPQADSNMQQNEISKDHDDRRSAVVFVSPPDRQIAQNLPPLRQHLQAVVQAAATAGVPAEWVSQLAQQTALECGNDNIPPEYHQTPDGRKMQAWPRIRTGSKNNR